MHPQAKLTDEQRVEVAELYSLGRTLAELARQFEVSSSTIQKIVKKADVQKPKAERSTPGTSIKEFAKRARSILWRQDGKVKGTYDSWKRKVEEFEKSRAMNPQQAIVQASKDFPCLKRLFREYDVSGYDPHPDSHPDIQHWGQKIPLDSIECENREQSFRENLSWAIETAGKYLRTGEHPTSTPNDGAYFLFKQACEQPKEFLGKFTQIEGRGDDGQEKRRRAREGGQRSIDEINEMLGALMEEKEEEN